MSRHLDEEDIADNPSRINYSRPSLAQVKALVEYMEKNPELANKKQRLGPGQSKYKKFWLELSKAINSIEGSVKSSKGWLKFWSDKKRFTMTKEKQIEEGRLKSSLTLLEQKILELSEAKPYRSRKKKAVKQEPCNGDDSYELNEDVSIKGGDSEADIRLLPTETEERQLTMLENMIGVMGQQASALTQMAQASLTNSKAMESIAEASHVQESGYTSIEVLNLSYNLIFWIGLHAFAGLEKLSHLDLSNNRLRYIPSDLFWDTPQLQNLDLSSNVFESLKNEPIVMHTKLQVLNLNNCRIKALPDRLFSRLPNLRKLDLSENYMVSISIQILQPMRKLERIELRNDYWQCNPDFIGVENWISSRDITYAKQCKRIRPKMSEKMISQVPVEREEILLDKIWNITVSENNTNILPDEKPLTPLEKFDKEFSALQAFVIGLEIGLALGIVGTYVWLRRVCLIPFNSWRPQSRRARRRARMEGDMRTSLLWSTLINPDTETPPLFRRQLSLPDRSAPYGIPGVTEARLQVDAIRVPDRSETPPPPYHDFRLNV